MATLTIHLPEDLHQRLGALAVQTGRTKAYHVCQALEQYLDDVEDADLAEAALAQHKAGNYQTMSHRDLGTELGFLDD